MSTAPVGPFVIVGDPSAAVCEGDSCPVPEVQEQVAAPEDQGRDPSPVEEASAPPEPTRRAAVA